MAIRTTIRFNKQAFPFARRLIEKVIVEAAEIAMKKTEKSILRAFRRKIKNRTGRLRASWRITSHYDGKAFIFKINNDAPYAPYVIFATRSPYHKVYLEVYKTAVRAFAREYRKAAGQVASRL